MSLLFGEKRLIRLLGLLIPAVITTLVGLQIIMHNDSADAAARAKDFNPGRIIDDAVFYNADAMTANQIQSFLNSKVPNCDTNGSQPATDWGRPDITRATLASYIRNGTHGYSKDTKFHAPPYTCLRNFKQNTPQVEAASGLCNALSSKVNRTAAEIISDVSKACGINPQVLIVLLNKEQSLVTDVWPLNHQYERATGFACPDNAGGACDPAYNGFFRQVYSAARQFKVYRALPNSYNYIAGRTNTIYWHPDLSRCGSSRVYIENQATAALYIYTPYRPNKASLDSYPGEGNSCSSYGNRNFWFMFTNWFGSTYSNKSFKQMKSPRWMQLDEDTVKVDPYTGEPIQNESTLKKGSHVYFRDIVIIDGIRYLRTLEDSKTQEIKAIPMTVLSEIKIEYVSLKKPRWLKLGSDLRKLDPITNTELGPTLASGRAMYFPTMAKINGELYLRSQADTHNNARTGIPLDSLEEVNIEYETLKLPRWFVVSKNTRLYDLKYPSASQTPILEKGEKIKLEYSVKINGQRYAVKNVPENGEYTGIPLDSLRNISDSDFRSLKYQRAYVMVDDTEKIQLKTNLPAKESIIKSGRPVYFQTLISLNGSLYLRSAHDTVHGKTTVVPLSQVNPVDVDFESMKHPRKLRVIKNVKKSDPVTLGKIDSVIHRGRVVRFSDKVVINGEMYLRTHHDSSRGHYKVIPLSALKNI